jgi:hypothetical protein
MLSLAWPTLCETSAWVRLRALHMTPLLIALFTLASCGGGAPANLRISPRST